MFPSAASGSQANPFAGTPSIVGVAVVVATPIDVVNVQGSGLLTGILIKQSSLSATLTTTVTAVEVDGVNIITGSSFNMVNGSGSNSQGISLPMNVKFNTSLRVGANSSGAGNSNVYVSLILGV